VAGGVVPHSGGIKAGTRAVEVGVDEEVEVAVCVAIGVAVGGKTACVTKLHARRDKIKHPKAIRFNFISSLIQLTVTFREYFKDKREFISDCHLFSATTPSLAQKAPRAA